MSDQATSFQFSRQSASSSDVESVIGPTLVIRGEVTAEEDLLIMGRVEGKIDHNQTLTVHGEGTVKATVKAKEIKVDGCVEGNMYGTERVKICETGQVVGNVYAPRVGLMEGATFKGMVDMDSDAAAIEGRFAEQTAVQAKNPAPPASGPTPVKDAADAEPAAGPAETETEREAAPKTAKTGSRNGGRKKAANKSASSNSNANSNANDDDNDKDTDAAADAGPKED